MWQKSCLSFYLFHIIFILLFNIKESFMPFKEGFLWGGATAANQCEVLKEK